MEKMQNAMMKQYKMFAWMGLIIVLIAFYYAVQGANANATFFSLDKAAREAAGSGAAVVIANVSRQSIATWVPSFKFLGLGIMLGAITMALGLIATTLRSLGEHVMGLWPDELNPGVPEKPRAAKMFPMLMLVGWMVLLIGLIAAFVTNSTVTVYFANSISGVLNQATEGSVLLKQLGFITGMKPWLGALRFAGMSFVFTAITVALSVVIRTLQMQETILNDYVDAQSG